MRGSVLPARLLAGFGLLIALSAHPAEPAIEFIDVAAEAGLDTPNVFGGVGAKKYILESTGSGAAFLDYDNDGRLDLFLVNGTALSPGMDPPPISRLYRNSGGGKFVDVSTKAGFTHSGWGQGVCAGDYDNDGWLDLLVTYWGQNRLYRNRGDGTFADVSQPARIQTPQSRWGTGCTFTDYDRDGRLDLFVANYLEFDLQTAPLPGSLPGRCSWKGIPVFCGPQGLPGGQNQLLRNQGDGTFADVSRSAGILAAEGTRYGLGAVASDLDNDGFPDIYVACDSTANLLYWNRGDGTFQEGALASGAAFNEDGREQAGMGVGVGDFDRNGWPDLVVTNFSDDTPTLYQNLGRRNFVDRTVRAGLAGHTRYLGWGTGFFDFDNDGRLDLYMANGHVYPEVAGRSDTTYSQISLLYRNRGDGGFEDATSRSGPGFARERPARGSAVGDYDGDGDLDILINNMNEPPSLLQNRSANRHHWLSVKTVGTRSNRSGIGTRVTLFYGRGESQTASVQSGGSWASQDDLRLHFGLGTAERVDRLLVEWPSGLKESHHDLEVDRVLVLEEGRAF